MSDGILHSNVNPSLTSPGPSDDCVTLSVCSNSSCKDCLFDDKYVVPLGGSIEADLYTGNEPFHQGVAKAKGLSPADPLDPLI